MQNYQNSTSLKEFQVINKLGEGSFSAVYKVMRLSDGLLYALKKVKMYMLSSKEKENALNEVRILASISDPNIVSLKEAFFDESSNSLCLIMDIAEGGDLLQKIKKAQSKGSYIPEQDIWDCMHQMIKGLKTLHDMKILHRDLKCANVFMTKEGKYLLGDLNVSKVAKKGLVRTQTGTPYYCAPEIWSDNPYDGKCDIWSIGCILYEMAALKPPFRAQDMQGLFRKITKGVYEPIPNYYSADLKLVLSDFLKVKPVLRPSVDQILQNPIVIRRVGGQNITEQKKPSKMELLNTIVLPRNLKDIQKKLPKANYDRQNQSFEFNQKEFENEKYIKPQPKLVIPESPKKLVRVNSAQPKNHSRVSSRESKEIPPIQKYQPKIISHNEKNLNLPPKPMNPKNDQLNRPPSNKQLILQKGSNQGSNKDLLSRINQKEQQLYNYQANNNPSKYRLNRNNSADYRQNDMYEINDDYKIKNIQRSNSKNQLNQAGQKIIQNQKPPTGWR